MTTPSPHHPARMAADLVLAATMISCALGPAQAQAAVKVYTASASFLAATTTETIATFDDLVNQSYDQVLDTQGIRITSMPGGHARHDVYIDPPAADNFTVANNSNVLDANGDENFSFHRVNGSSFGAIGFDYYANQYGAPTFALYDSRSALIASITVQQAPSTLGFIGFTSSIPIAFMTTTVDRGWIQNTGFDNLRIGSVSTVPEPAVTWFWLSGLAALAGLARRSRN